MSPDKWCGVILIAAPVLWFVALCFRAKELPDDMHDVFDDEQLYDQEQDRSLDDMVADLERDFAMWQREMGERNA